jgi:hypothetical protein
VLQERQEARRRRRLLARGGGGGGWGIHGHGLVGLKRKGIGARRKGREAGWRWLLVVSAWWWNGPGQWMDW